MELTLNGHLNLAEKVDAAEKGQTEINHVIAIVQPHSLLPKPEAPSGSLLWGLKSPMDAGKVGEEGVEGSFRGLAESFRFLRDRSSSLSAVIAKTLSAKVMAMDDDEVTEIDLKGLKVVVSMKTKEEDDLWKAEEETVLKGTVRKVTRSQ